jgi:hypothetical protein
MQLVARTYPDAGALTMGRLAKILYLADWYATCDTGSSVTGLRWLFDERGPSAQELGAVLADESRFRVRSVQNHYGSVVRVIEAVDALDVVAVPYAVWDAVGKAVNLAATAEWPVFLATVLETPPLATAAYGQYVDPAAYGGSELPGAA